MTSANKSVLNWTSTNEIWNANARPLWPMVTAVEIETKDNFLLRKCIWKCRLSVLPELFNLIVKWWMIWFALPHTTRYITPFRATWKRRLRWHGAKSPGPCITNVFATRSKNFSQWHRSFQRKLRSHWLKFLRHVATTLVLQGPGSCFNIR